MSDDWMVSEVHCTLRVAFFLTKIYILCSCYFTQHVDTVYSGKMKPRTSFNDDYIFTNLIIQCNQNFNSRDMRIVLCEWLNQTFF